MSGITATVHNGRIEVAAPPAWVEGTEVEIFLVLRPNLTASDSPRTAVELGLILDLQEQERQAHEAGTNPRRGPHGEAAN